MHSVGCGKFYCWVYHNGKDIDPAKELRIFNSLHNQYELKELGWTKFSFQYAPAEDYEHYENSLIFFSVNIKKDSLKKISKFIKRVAEILNFAQNIVDIRVLKRLHLISVARGYCYLRLTRLYLISVARGYCYLRLTTYYYFVRCCCFACVLKRTWL